jgi:PPOX class probable F420-dependent enzyme
MPAVYQRQRITEEQAQLFLDKNYAVVATLRDDGSPHQTLTWIDWDGERVVFNTAEGRAKPEQIDRNPHVSVFVRAEGDPWTWISVSGAAEMTREGAAEHIHELSRKYRGREYDQPEGRIIVRVKPERVTAYGF